MSEPPSEPPTSAPAQAELAASEAQTAVTRPNPHGHAVKQLPPKLANQIAAGEVVARPASVVKELCENAVDAGADRIRVEVEGGGIGVVRVIDNGHGMSEEDARLAMRRHATSKLRSVDDLLSLTTLGFRGEALPSIASVGRFVLRTRRHNDPSGVELRCDGGESPDVRPCGCAPGTTVELADLFFNVPARRKFLRAVSTESAHITEVVRDVALAHPHVGVELVRDGRRTKRWLPVTTREERVRDTLEGYALIPCLGERGPVRVEAYLSRPERARSGATGLAIFVCGRPVRDRALARAVATAYADALDRGRFPAGVLFIELPRELVDVNVHPQKAEVRFAHARAVTDAVFAVVSAAVSGALGLTPSPKTITAPAFRPPVDSDEGWTWNAPPPRPQPAAETVGVAPPASLGEATPNRRFIGTVRNRFLLFEARDAILVVDGRRARAALLTRALARELSNGCIVAQRLLFPIGLNCDGGIADAAERASEALDRIGFELRRTGPGQLTAHTIPRLLADGPVELLLSDVLDSLGAASQPPWGIDTTALLSALAQRTAEASGVPAPADVDDAAVAEATATTLPFSDFA